MYIDTFCVRQWALASKLVPVSRWADCTASGQRDESQGSGVVFL